MRRGDLAGLLLHHRPGREQGRRVEVALDSMVEADFRPGLAQVHPPVETDDIAAGIPHGGEQGGGPGAEMNRRRSGGTQSLEDGRDVRLHRAPIVCGGQRAHPAVEQLDNLGARLDLGSQVGEDEAAQPTHQRIPELRFSQHHRFSQEKIARGFALD